jgi:hypothetical protein
MVTTGSGVYLLQQLAALIPGDTPHEYVGGPALVELAVDEDKCFGSAGNASGFYLVGRELPLDQPLEDGEPPVGILKVYFWWLVDCHDLGPQFFGWLLVTPDFPKKTKCLTICMPGSSFIHIVTS